MGMLGLGALLLMSRVAKIFPEAEVCNAIQGSSVAADTVESKTQ